MTESPAPRRSLAELTADWIRSLPRDPGARRDLLVALYLAVACAKVVTEVREFGWQAGFYLLVWFAGLYSVGRLDGKESARREGAHRG